MECAPEASSGGRGGGRELGGDGGKDPDDEVTRHICADLRALGVSEYISGCKGPILSR